MKEFYSNHYRFLNICFRSSVFGSNFVSLKRFQTWSWATPAERTHSPVSTCRLRTYILGRAPLHTHRPALIFHRYISSKSFWARWWDPTVSSFLWVIYILELNQWRIFFGFPLARWLYLLSFYWCLFLLDPSCLVSIKPQVSSQGAGNLGWWLSESPKG